MSNRFSLEHWEDGGWFVGKLKEAPGVFSQGETLHELIENIHDAYRSMLEESNAVNINEEEKNPLCDLIKKQLG